MSLKLLPNDKPLSLKTSEEDFEFLSSRSMLIPSSTILCKNQKGEGLYSYDLQNNIKLTCVRLEENPESKTIALNLNKPFYFLSALLACNKYKKNVALLPNLNSGTIENFKNEFDFILTDEDFEEKRTDEVLNLAPSKKETSSFSLKINLDQNIYFFTSGSTGKPKKISKKLAHINEEVRVLEDTFAKNFISKDVEFLASVSHQHIYGFIFKLIWPFFTGRCFSNYIIEYPEQIDSRTETLSSFVFISSPAFLKRFQVSRLFSTQKNQFIFSSGGVLEKNIADHIYSIFKKYPIEVFGSTETGGVAYKLNSPQRENLWTPFSCLQISQSATDKTLVVKSPYFSEPFIKMEDLVDIDALSKFRLLGRKDRILKIEEKRVSLEEMERHIKKHPLVNEVHLFLDESHTRQQIACVALLSHKGFEFLKSNGKRTLTRDIRDSLSLFFEVITLPRKFRFVKEFPTNTQGKVTLETLKELLK